MSISFAPGGFHPPHIHADRYGEIEGKPFDVHITRRLLGYLGPYRREMALAVFFMLVSSGLTLLTPYLIKKTIDEHIAVGNAEGLRTMALAILGCFVLDFFAQWRQRYTLNKVGNDILRTMRDQLFRHYQVLSMSFFDQRGTGTLISRMLSDVGVINELLSQGIVTMAGDIIMVVSVTIVMIALNAPLALLSLSVLPVMALSAYFFGKKARAAFRRTREKVSILTGRLAEDINAMRVIEAFAQEDRMSREFDQINRDNRDANVAAVALSSFFTPAMEVLSVIATCIILWVGGRAVAGGTLTLGVIVAFLTYTSRLFQPVLDLSMVFTTWQAAMAGGERIFEILDLEPDVKDAPNAQPLTDVQGHIVFDHVDFEYVSGVPVLQDVSFEIKPGETVALVGATGAGKTTIALLLVRFYDVTGGRILIDGHDIREIKVADLRRLLGVVPQEPFLFQGTIAYNIAFGRPEATREEIIAAAKAANAHDFIMRLPNGYDTEVLESSTNLSLGQRQLICLARVILAQPQILILDEATSSVDLRTEGLIQDALEKLMAGRTSLVIAHRLATVQRAGQILVVDGGRIVERGTHEELLALNGIYAQLYRTQFLTVEEAPVAVEAK